MYTVLIAEDELLVRMGIASSVPWAQMEMRVVAETVDGAAAWEAFEKFHPDIVIADIRMPKLDGTELLRRIRGVDQDCAVIIVTNVEHGPTLEEVRRLGITDVLIKATMKRDDITAAVLKARQSLPEERGRELLAEDNEELWQEFLRSPGMSAEVFREKCAQSNAVFFEPKGFAFMHIRASERMSHRLKTSLVSLLEHRLASSEDFCIVKLENGVAVLIRGEYDADRVERLLRELGRYVRDNFGEELNFVVRHGDYGLDALRRGLEQAEGYTRQKMFFDQNVLRMDESGTPDFHGLAEAAQALRRCVLTGAKGAALAQCADDLDRVPKELARSWRAGEALGEQILERLKHPAKWEGVHALIGALVQAAQQTAEEVQASMRPEIRAAIDYIEAHISDELSIRHVSAIAGYHPAYFSNLFKKELGMSYSDFLAGLRIRRAKEMLTGTGLSLQQIADACGFSDLSYFSAKFKRMVGMTPSQWRAKV